MGVYIKGMEMPQNCGECPMICEHDICLITKGGRTLDERPPHCPLVEIPPHGDLIDRDAFICDMSKGVATIGQLLNAPTIIPAEGADK